MITPVPKVIYRTEPWWTATRVLMACAWTLLVAGTFFAWGYLWPRPGVRAAIIQATPEELPQGVVQLYPRDPNVQVKMFDAVGRWVEARLTPDGYATLKEYTR